MNSLTQRFEVIIRSSLGIAQDDRILVAISGGIDSVVLAHLFKSVNEPIALAHVNYHLRGEESIKDEQFVRDLAELWKVECFVLDFDMSKTKSAIQENARNSRYDFFKKLSQKNGFEYISTGHHLDDQLETFLINLSRGTGIKGLLGIPEKKDNVVRPLLDIKKSEIEEFALEQKINYRQDQSNLSNNYLRNRIRNKVIPLLLEENANLLDNFNNTLDRLREVGMIYSNEVNKLKEELLTEKNGDIELKLDNVLSAPMLFELIESFGFNYDQAMSIFKNKENTGQKYIGHNTTGLLDRGQFLITKNKDPVFAELILDRPDKNININGLLRISITQVSEYHYADNNDLEFIDAEKIKWPLVVRSWRDGDKFYPLGMDGKSQKLQDYLSNNKINQFEKKRILLLADREGIIWIMGHRLDHKVRITPKTKSVIKLEITHSQHNPI